MCGCQIGRTVKRKSKKQKSVALTWEDFAFAGAGVLAGMALNPLANKVLEGQDEKIRNVVGTALPAAKTIGGGALAMQASVDRRARFFGVGVGLEGVAELGLKYIPEQYVRITGVDGDVFSFLGDTTIEIPIQPSASASLPSGSAMFENEAILGTDVYEAMEMEQEVI